MLQFKDTHHISELKADFEQSEKTCDRFLDWLTLFKFSSAFSDLADLKKKGYSATELFRVLLIVPFLGKASVYAMLRSGYSKMSDASKDAYYRLKMRDEVNWGKILLGFVKQFTLLVRDNGETVKGRRMLIIDDTLLPKRGKTIEGAGKLWDHVSMRYLLGLRLLLLGYFDGKSFLPVSFSLHREKGKNPERRYGLTDQERARQYGRDRDPKSPQGKRAQSMDDDKMSVAIKLIKRASRFLAVDYLLMDSWFTCKKMIDCALALNIHLIGMMKMGKALYAYQGEVYTAAELLQKCKGDAKKCRRLKSSYIDVSALYGETPVKLFFSRFGHRGKWHLLLTTDKKLSYPTMMELYQIRWGIEVFFKESKQYLHLGKSQAEDFSSQIADLTISMIQYILLTLRKRFGDYETRGAVFREAEENIRELTLDHRLWGLLLELLTTIIEILNLKVDDLEELLSKIMENDEFKRLLKPDQNLKTAA